MTGGKWPPPPCPASAPPRHPWAVNTDDTGMPIKVADLLAGLQTTAYITRQTVIKPKFIKRTKKAIQTGLHLPA
jgi:2-oxoglutarate ferredoxin oxidoreductase subunit beta